MPKNNSIVYFSCSTLQVPAGHKEHLRKGNLRRGCEGVGVGMEEQKVRSEPRTVRRVRAFFCAKKRSKRGKKCSVTISPFFSRAKKRKKPVRSFFM